MRETLYSPPEENGPQIMRKTYYRCHGCKWADYMPKLAYVCSHPEIVPTPMMIPHPMQGPSPEWCPIVTSDPETWEKRLKGEGT